MSDSLASPWSPNQQRMLLAMEYTLFVPAGSPVTRPAEAREEPSPRLAPDTVSTPDRERLLSALRRAAGRREVDLAVLVPDLEALRRDPRLKRALWPRLRMLRRP